MLDAIALQCPNHVRSTPNRVSTRDTKINSSRFLVFTEDIDGRIKKTISTSLCICFKNKIKHKSPIQRFPCRGLPVLFTVQLTLNIVLFVSGKHRRALLPEKNLNAACTWRTRTVCHWKFLVDMAEGNEVKLGDLYRCRRYAFSLLNWIN